MRCASCYKPSNKDFCNKCRKELFHGKDVSKVLPFDIEVSDLEYQKHINKLSISGVQVKYSFELEGNQLKLTEDGGEYILKPVPVGTFKHLEVVPENEHVSMQIARQVFNLQVPPNALLQFENGNHAYLVKRFDVKPNGGKKQQEDFAQIAKITSESHGDNYKYDISCEEIAELIQKHVAAYPIESERFFRLVLFNFLICNGDAHAKNFSLILSEFGDYMLSPVYDVLCTKIHVPYESDMALELFKNNYYTEAFNKIGFHTSADFLEFGSKIGMKQKRVKRFIAEAINAFDQIETLVEKSFLNQKFKGLYLAHVKDRTNRLKQ